ncbi:MAG: PAS domain-containing protein [Dehalococcoidia bacterium]
MTTTAEDTDTKRPSLLAGLHAAAEVMADSVYIKDRQGRYTWINPAGARFLGRPAGEVIGRRTGELFSRRSARGIEAEDKHILETGETVTRTAVATATGVRRPYLTTKGPVRNGQGVIIGVFGVSREITGSGLARQLAMAVPVDARNEAARKAVLEERSRIAREIHDTLTQDLAGIIWYLSAMDRVLDEGRASVAEVLGEVRTMAVNSLKDVRRAVMDLQPAALEGASLQDAVRAETEALEKRGISAVFTVTGSPRLLEQRVEATVLRVCQEALSNVVKHAEPTEVNVTLGFDDDAIHLCVQDNGNGFDLESCLPQAGDLGGFGLAGMRERARLAMGRLDVVSRPGAGTTVCLVVPAGKMNQGDTESCNP